MNYTVMMACNGDTTRLEYGVQKENLDSRLDFWFGEKLDDLLNEARNEADWGERKLKAQLNIQVYAIDEDGNVVAADYDDDEMYENQELEPEQFRTLLVDPVTGKPIEATQIAHGSWDFCIDEARGLFRGRNRLSDEEDRTLLNYGTFTTRNGNKWVIIPMNTGDAL